MGKRLSEEQKKIIVDSFKNGASIEDLSNNFDCTNTTIIRNLKKSLGETLYKELNEKNKNSLFVNKTNENLRKNRTHLALDSSKNDLAENENATKSETKSNPYLDSEFFEIPPLNIEIENTSRKEYSSISLDEIEFPKIVYMIVSKNIELEIKLLSDYPEWEFLPNEDLKRKTIEIYFDLKAAKRVCKKEQKVIKVPNTDVFRIVSPILISKGISRIVTSEKLIAL